MTITLDPICVEAVVPGPPTRAFDGFANRLVDWWPLDTHSISGTRMKVRPQDVVVAPHIGGKIVETAVDGSTHVWGEVEEWDPPHALVLRWRVGRVPDQATRVAVTFTPTDDGKTAIRLEHSDWHVLGDAAAEIHPNYRAGWTAILGTHFLNFMTRQEDAT